MAKNKDAHNELAENHHGPNWGAFHGYSKPSYTMVPDELLDQHLPFLSGAELKVILYIVRKTFGWKKESDNISLSQMLDGIRSRDGGVVDYGVGLSKKTLLQALASLEEKGLILRERRRSAEKGNEPTSYQLRMAASTLGGETTPSPLGEKLHQGVGGEIPPSPRSKNSPTQQTPLQQTTLQSSKFELAKSEENGGKPADILPPSNGSPQRGGDISAIGDILAKSKAGQPRGHDDAKEAIAAYIRDFARELGDRAPMRSSITRAYGLFVSAEVALPTFVDALFRARATVREQRREVQGAPVRNGMAYFFGCLEQDLGLAEAALGRNGASG